MATTSCMAATAVVLALACWKAQAQVYEFEATALPENNSLDVLQLFYVLPPEESPTAGRTSGPATLEFRGLESSFAPEATGVAKLPGYHGVQVSLLPQPQDLTSALDPKNLCSAEGRLVVSGDGRGLAHSHAVRSGPRGPATADQEGELAQGGVWMLVLSNCGALRNGTLSGSVAVRHPHGFLPGSEYHKKPFFCWLAALYAAMVVAWLGAFLLRREDVLSVHWYIAAVACIGLAEAAAWWVHLSRWNETGSAVRALHCTAVVTGASKLGLAYAVCLEVSAGWGVTQQSLGTPALRKREALVILYMVACYVRDSVLSLRHSRRLAAGHVVGSLVPAALLNALIFAWALGALRDLAATLAERNQEHSRKLMLRSRSVLVGAVAVAYAAFLVQLLEAAGVVGVAWRYHWVLSDAAPHMIFALALGVFTLLWQPNADLMGYAYSPKVPTDEDGEGGQGFAVPDQGTLPDDDDGSETEALVRGDGAAREGPGVPPEKIGLGAGRSEE